MSCLPADHNPNICKSRVLWHQVAGSLEAGFPNQRTSICQPTCVNDPRGKHQKKHQTCWLILGRSSQIICEPYSFTPASPGNPGKPWLDPPPAARQHTPPAPALCWRSPGSSSARWPPAPAGPRQLFKPPSHRLLCSVSYSEPPILAFSHPCFRKQLCHGHRISATAPW